MSTETPLTDDQILLRWSGESGIVPADFARGLELRLAASTAALAALCDAITLGECSRDAEGKECDAIIQARRVLAASNPNHP